MALQFAALGLGTEASNKASEGELAGSRENKLWLSVNVAYCRCSESAVVVLVKRAGMNIYDADEYAA
jgi:hypothetical protein